MGREGGCGVGGCDFNTWFPNGSVFIKFGKNKSRYSGINFIAHKFWCIFHWEKRNTGNESEYRISRAGLKYLENCANCA